MGLFTRRTPEPTPKPETPESIPRIPDDLHDHYTHVTQQWLTAHPHTVALDRAHYDARRGTLSLIWDHTTRLDLAVSDHTNAEQIYSMTRLGRTHMRLMGRGPYLTIVASSDGWTYLVTGLPAGRHTPTD